MEAPPNGDLAFQPRDKYIIELFEPLLKRSRAFFPPFLGRNESYKNLIGNS